MPTGNLGGSGKDLFERIYNKALEGSCKGDKGCAAATAWSAIKGAGYHKNAEGKWIKESSFLAEAAFSIVKCSFDKSSQTYNWRMVASDTGKDLYDEQMSPELYADFVDRAQKKLPIPDAFRSRICQNDGWCGGIPYLSVSHYPDGAGRFVPGIVEDIYVDGNRLKAKGKLSDNPLGQAVWKALNKDLYGQSEYQDKIRVSIGFLDLEHKHLAAQGGQDYLFTRKDLDQICPLCEQGIGNKIYMKGQLVHLALTRVPVNPRTEMEVEKAMTNGEILTKKDDAKSIVGDLVDIFDELETKSIIIVRADGTSKEYTPDDFKRVVGETPKPDDHKYEKCYDPDTNSYDQDCMDSMMMGQENVAEFHMQKVRSKIVEKATTKGESWGDEGASSYLVVEDPKHPTTWHLPVKKNGKLDTGLMGAAKAALTSNHRGKSYGGPGKEAAISKLKALYKSHGMDWESKSFAEDSTMADKMSEKDMDDEKKEKEEEAAEGEKSKVSKETAKEASEESANAEQAENEKEAKGKGKKDAVAKSQMEDAFEALRSKVLAAKSGGMTQDLAEEIQGAFAQLGTAVQQEAVPAVADPSNIAEVVRSVVNEALDTRFAELRREIAVQVASATKAPINPNSIRNTARRSLSLPVTKDNVLLQNRSTATKINNGKPLTQIQKLARRSTGLDVPEE